MTEEQFIQAYEDFVDPLFRHGFFKVSDRDIAKDLVQETFTKAWVFIASGKDIQNIKALLYKILNNLIIDYYRKHKTTSLDELEESGFDVEDTAARISIDTLDGERVMLLIQKLAKEYREVIFMKYVNNLEIDEIAAILEEKENTIAVRVHRGLKKLKELYI